MRADITFYKKDFSLTQESTSAILSNNLLIEIYNFLSNLEADYPNFREWYFEKVIPEVKNGERNIFFKYSNYELSGVAIAKKNFQEKKICTVKVADKFKNKGIGVKLFHQSFLWLGSKEPLATVSEKRLVEFERVFEYFNFNLTEIRNNYYKFDSKEYVFNGTLDPV